uniref:Uncharacterized protein n=1 Tax=Oryctolagus cuniculus TaxID=9986 RepID=A0A5F9D880_RABIT
MLLLLHEQDKMAPDWSHPEVNKNIRSSSEAILYLIPGKVTGRSRFRPAAPFPQRQDGLPKGSMQYDSSKRTFRFQCF